MHNTEKSVAVPITYIFFKSLLLLYPDTYRRKFEEEMVMTFEDMYQEKMLKDGETGIPFWFHIYMDIVANAFEQHWQLLRKQGLKKYTEQTLHINRYNIIGGLLLLPFFSVFLVDIIARIAQGDVTHYNRPVYSLLSHSLLYWFPVLFTWVILFPVLAVLINLFPLIKNILKKHGSVLRFDFIRQNIISLTLLTIGLGFLAIILLHDLGPCVVHGLLRFGFGKLPYILSFCRNA